MFKQNLSVTNAASNVIQNACEHLIRGSEWHDHSCGQINAVLEIVSRARIPADELQAFVSRWQQLLPDTLRSCGKSGFAVLVEDKLSELVEN